ncbi:hypothetical protein MHBO_000494, partial [Bonamia ostreae]
MTATTLTEKTQQKLLTLIEQRNYKAITKICNMLLSTAKIDTQKKQLFQKIKIICSIHLGKFDEAIKDLAHPEKFPFEYAYCHYRLDKLDDSNQNLKKILQTDPKRSPRNMKNLLAQIQYKKGNFAGAARLYEQIKERHYEEDVNLLASLINKERFGTENVSENITNSKEYEFLYNRALKQSLVDKNFELSQKTVSDSERNAVKLLKSENANNREIQTELFEILTLKAINYLGSNKPEDAKRILQTLFEDEENAEKRKIAKINLTALENSFGKSKYFQSKRNFSYPRQKMLQHQKLAIRVNNHLTDSLVAKKKKPSDKDELHFANSNKSNFAQFLEKIADLNFDEAAKEHTRQTDKSFVWLPAVQAIMANKYLAEIESVKKEQTDVDSRKSGELFVLGKFEGALKRFAGTDFGETDGKTKILYLRRLLDDAVQFCLRMKNFEAATRFLEKKLGFELSGPERRKTNAELALALSFCDANEAKDCAMKLGLEKEDFSETKLLSKGVSDKMAITTYSRKKKTETEEEEDAKKRKQKNEKKIEKIGKEDLERWLPLKQRSYFKPKKTRKKNINGA